MNKIFSDSKLPWKAFACLLLSVISAWIIYGLFGRGLVESIYEQRSFNFLNKIIKGKDLFSLEYYLRKADFFMLKITVFMLVPVLLMPLFSKVRSWKFKKGFILFLILLIFLLSVFIRLPHLGRHLCDHLEWLTAEAIITIENLQIQGLLKHNCNILHTYPLEADKFIKNVGIHIIDENGNGYYPSFPPFSIILPVVLFNILSIKANLLGIQIINMVFHLIASVFVYKILQRIFKDEEYKEIISLTGSAFFVLLAPHLWYFSNIYVWDIFWKYFWVMGIYWITKISDDISEGQARKADILILSFINFLLIYTENHGVLFAASVFLYALVNWKRSPYYKQIIIAVTCSSFLSAGLIFFHYSSISGVKAFIDFLIETGKRRSFLVEADPKRIISYYKHCFTSIFLPIFFMVSFLIYKKRQQFFKMFSKRERTLFYFSLFPVITHHLLMLQWTAQHESSVVKTGVFLVFLLAVLMNKVMNCFQKKEAVLSVLLAFLIAFLMITVLQYKAHFVYSKDTERFYRTGREIKEAVRDDEVVFVVTNEMVYPHVIYYAKRNMQEVKNEKEAIKWLQKYNRKKGVVFYLRYQHGKDVFHMEEIKRIDDKQ